MQTEVVHVGATAHRYFVAFRTIVIKEYLRIVRIWMQSILPPVITTVLYLLIFGNLIGSRIGSMDGFDYIEYIVPGVIMLAVITNSYSNVVSSFFSAKFQHSIEELLVSPIPNWIIVAGYVGGGVVRGLLVGGAVTAVTMLFTSFDVHNYFVTVSVVVLTAALFSLGGLINAIFADNFDDISIVPTFVLTPLTYLGGIFYSISLLPEFWQAASLANPILYMVNAFRFGILGVSDIDIGLAFSIILLFIAALSAVALFLLHRGIGIKN